MILTELPDTVSDVIQILGTAGISALIAGFWLWLRDRGRTKVDAAKAVNEGGAELVSQSNEFVAKLIGRIDCLDGRICTAENRIDKQEHTIAEQTTEIHLLRTVVSMWSAFWMDLKTRWDYHRGQEEPPPGPVIPELQNK